MTLVTLPAAIYYGIIERCTTSTDRLIQCDRGRRLPNGDIQFELQAKAQELLHPYMLEGESYAQTIERLYATAGGRVS